ncbi:MAG: hypothetical protein QOK37_1756 [Thermoanaerobaculia bacterium]|jgi:hypothetical protein|nr:hypothetical protein [Thermoanaerobaculia bacterium]
MTARRWFVLLFVTLFLGSMTVSGSPAAARQKKSAKTPRELAASQPVGIPTPEAGGQDLSQTDLGRMLKRESANLSIQRAPDGATVLDLEDGFRSVMVVQIKGGAPVVSCIATEKEAAAIFAPVAPKPTAVKSGQ